MQIAMQPQNSELRNEGIFTRWMDWIAGSAETRQQQQHQQQVQEAENLASSIDSTELLPSHSWVQQTVFASPEEEWRHDCMAFARVRDLHPVEQMRAFYVDNSALDAKEGAEVTVIAVGAHYKQNVATQEDMLLHVLREMETVGSRPYTLIYFNAETQLPTIPDTSFLQQIHAALDPSHKRNLKAFYVVHPTRVLKYWIFMLRLAIPEIYGRVKYIDKLEDLYKALDTPALVVPQHVQDFDN